MPTFDHFAELPPLYKTTADYLLYGGPLEAAAHEPVEGE